MFNSWKSFHHLKRMKGFDLFASHELLAGTKLLLIKSVFLLATWMRLTIYQLCSHSTDCAEYSQSPILNTIILAEIVHVLNNH